MTAEDPNPETAAGAPPADRDIFGRTPREGTDWSHRRGEPRMFALLWTAYLMLAVIAVFFGLGPIGSYSPEMYRPRARLLLVWIVAGVVVLWPLVRLSQRPIGIGRDGRPKSAGRAVAADLIVVLLPAMALVWPQVLLADWPSEVVLAASAVLVVSGITVGPAVYLGVQTARVATRMTLMGVVLAWSVGVAGLALAGFDSVGMLSDGPWPLWMASPITAVLDVVRDRGWSGRSAAVSAGHWRAIGAMAVAGLFAWAGAVAARLVLARPAA